MARHGKSSKSSHSEPLDLCSILRQRQHWVTLLPHTVKSKGEIVAGKSILMQLPVLQWGLAS